MAIAKLFFPFVVWASVIVRVLFEEKNTALILSAAMVVFWGARCILPAWEKRWVAFVIAALPCSIVLVIFRKDGAESKDSEE